MRTCKALALVFLLLTRLSLSGQTDNGNIDSLAAKLVKTLRSDISENIFIHADKSVYKAGETIWFYAYLVNRISHKLSNQSNVVFVDLVNEQDSVAGRSILDPRSLRLDGAIMLPLSIREGSYWLRAYTFNILKHDSSEICVHSLYVVNAQNQDSTLHLSTTTTSPSSQSLAPKLELFPEGGSLIAGATCVVAFQVTDRNNNPIDAVGYLKDNRDSVTTAFKTTVAGYGKFSFFPWKLRQYRACIKTSDGHEYCFPLPAIRNNAASLSIVSENKYSYEVLVSLGDSLYDHKAITYLLGISRDSLCYSSVGQQMYKVIVPKQNFPQGEATLLLFDEHQRLLSERMVYNDLNSINPDMRMDKDSFAARQSMAINIAINDAYMRPVLSLFTASVTDNGKIRYFDDNDVADVLIKNSNADERDLMLLTERKRYHSWGEAGSNFSLSTKAIRNGFFDVKGIVKDSKNKPIPGASLLLLTVNPETVSSADTTDADGRFVFPMNGYYDTTKFAIQVSNVKGKHVDAKVALDSTLLPAFTTPQYLKKFLPPGAIDEIEQRRREKPDFLLPGIGKELKEVTIRTKVKKELTYQEKQRVSQFSKLVTGDMLRSNGVHSINTAIAIIPGVIFRGGKITVAGSFDEPLLIIDGVEFNQNTLRATQENGSSPVTSALNTVNPDQIDYIEVLTGGDAAIYGMRGGNGVIIVHTTTTVKDFHTGVSSLTQFHRTGFTSPNIFTEPNYNDKNVRKTAPFDTRTTIYWSGSVITDKNGKATLNFFTADPSTIYTITLKGITVNGDVFLKRTTVSRK